MSGITLQTVQEEWAKDCEIDSLDIANEIVKAHRLHQKYNDLWIAFSAKVTAHEQRIKQIRKDKRDYYKGRLPDSSPFKIVEAEIGTYIEADEEYQKVERLLMSAKMAVTYIDRCLENLKFRGNHLKTAMEWEIRQSGGR